jgi:uncharacterized protein (TIGR00288 family)
VSDVTQPARRLALLVDGENLPADFAKAIMAFASARGEIRVQRVYGSESHLGAWKKQRGYRVIPTTIGRNCADVALAVDAMELAADGRVDRVVIASSDSDFGHLVQRLTARGVTPFGVGRANAKLEFQDAFEEFLALQDDALHMEVSQIDRHIGDLILSHGKEGRLLISDLTTYMSRFHAMPPRVTGFKDWAIYLRSKPLLYAVTKGKSGRKVRLLISREEFSVLPVQEVPLRDVAAPTMEHLPSLDPAEVVATLREVLKTPSRNGGLMLSQLGTVMAKRHRMKKGSLPQKNWRKFIRSIPDVVRIEGDGANARVFLVNGSRLPQSAYESRQDLTSADIAQAICSVVRHHGTNGQITLSQLSNYMESEHGIRRQDLPERRWYDFLSSRPHLYRVGPKGPDTAMQLDPALAV